MRARSFVAILTPVAFQLRTYWRRTLTLLVLGVLAVALLAPSRSLAHGADHGAPALLLPDIPSAGSALAWTTTARTPAGTQRQSLSDLLSLLSGLAWIGFGVASVSVFSCHAAAARDRVLDMGVRRAVGASVKNLFWSLILETVILAVIALGMGLAVGAALLSVARHQWPGPVTAILTADPATILALAATLGAAGLTSFRLVVNRDMVEPPSREIGLTVPTYQVAVSVALLMGAAALLANPVRHTDTRDIRSASAHLLRIDSGTGSALERSRRYGALLRSVAELPKVSEVSLTSGGSSLGLGTSGDVVTDCGRCFFGMIQIRWPAFPALAHAVSADTFSAQGIPLSAGRAFGPADTTGAQRVAVVNRPLAMRYYQGGEALGRDIFLGPGWPKTAYKVIGIVDDQRSSAIGGAIQPRETLYLSVLQHPPTHAELLIRYAAPGDALGDGIFPVARRAMGPGASVSRLGTLAELRSPQTRAIRWVGATLGVSAIMVLAMALIGTTATARMWSDSMAWEIALRRSVGATRRRMAGLVVMRTATVAVMGGTIGLLLYATVIAPALSAWMPGIRPADLPLLGGAAGAPMLLALLAAVTPGLRLLARPPSGTLR